MRFDNKMKRIICICLAVAMAVPIAVGMIYMFIGM